MPDDIITSHIAFHYGVSDRNTMRIPLVVSPSYHGIETYLVFFPIVNDVRESRLAKRETISPASASWENWENKKTFAENGFYEIPDWRSIYRLSSLSRILRETIKGKFFRELLSFCKNMVGGARYFNSSPGTITCLIINIFNVKFVLIILTL